MLLPPPPPLLPIRSMIIARVAPPVAGTPGHRVARAGSVYTSMQAYLQVARHVGEEKAAAELAREDASAAWGDLSARPS